jgi:hypothetical protein
MKTYEVVSSAIQKIVVEDLTASITWTNGKQYSYEIVSPDWVSSLETVIADPDGSVGSFVNRSIREDDTLRVVVVS